MDEERLTELLANQESAYDATVAEADAALGLLVDTVAELGLTDRTLFVVTSDHGEEFLEHGLLYHGSQLHEELVRAPLVLAGPSIPAGVRTCAGSSSAALPTPERAARVLRPSTSSRRPDRRSTPCGWEVVGS